MTHSLHLTAADSQYAGVADHADFDLSTFTIEAWIKLDTIPSEFHIAGKWRTTDNNRSYRFMIDTTGSQFRLDTSSAGTAESQSTVSIGSTLKTGVWYHVAVTKTGTTTKFYLNGREYTGGGTTESSVFNSSAPFRVGANGNATSGGHIDGYVKHVRLFDDVRTASEIATDAHTDGVSDANLVAEYKFDNAYTDSSGNSHTLTSSGSPVFSVDLPWEAPAGIESTEYACRLQSASSMYLSHADNANLEISGDMTFQGWFNFTTLPTGGGNFTVANRDPDDGSNRVWALRLYESSGQYKLGAYNSSDGTNSGTTGNILSSAFNLKAGEWVHLAWIFSSGNLKAYVNGVLVSSTSGLNSSMYTGGTSQLTIGAYDTGVSAFVNGMMYRVRLFDDERTQTEILSDALASTVSNANLIGEWELDNAYTDGSGNGLTLTANNSPTFVLWRNNVAGNLSSHWEMEESSGTRVDSKGGNDLTDNNTVTSGTGKQGTAGDFERGNSEYLSITDASQVDLDPTNNFSFALWFNLESATTAAAFVILSKKGSGSNRSFVLKLSNAGTVAMQASSAGASFDRDTSVTWTETTAAWHHLVVTWLDGAVTYYIDGVQVGTPQAAGGTSIFDSNGNFEIGREATGSDHFDGLLDEVGVYKRPLSYGDVLDLYASDSGILFTPETSLSIDVNDAITITESVTMMVDMNVNVNDALTITESVTMMADMNIGVNDVVTITESVEMALENFINVSDDISITESVTVEQTNDLSISVSDNISITESVTALITELHIGVNDTVSIAESVSAAMENFINVSDSITISESVTTTVVITINVSDSVSISESASAGIVNFINVNDAISITESVSLTVPDQRTGLIKMRSKQQEYPLSMDDGRIL